MLLRAPGADCRVAIAAVLGSVVFAACGQNTEELSCTLKDCGGVSSLSFAARDNGSVAPSGQIRHSNPDWGTRDFDCRDSEMQSTYLPCTNGVLTLGMPLSSGDALEIRFELQDGSMSDWQRVPLSFTAHTIEDFNGPGCPCTYYTVTAPRIAVPAGALLTAQGANDSGT